MDREDGYAEIGQKEPSPAASDEPSSSKTLWEFTVPYSTLSSNAVVPEMKLVAISSPSQDRGRVPRPTRRNPKPQSRPLRPRHNHGRASSSKPRTRKHNQRDPRDIRSEQPLLQQVQDRQVPKRAVDETAAAQADKHNGRSLCLFPFQKSRRGFHGIEPFDRDAEGDESQSGAGPGQEGPLVREMVSRYAAGVGDGCCFEEFGPLGHGAVVLPSFLNMIEDVPVSR